VRGHIEIPMAHLSTRAGEDSDLPEQLALDAVRIFTTAVNAVDLDVAEVGDRGWFPAVMHCGHVD
jgi:hypothetical protein